MTIPAVEAALSFVADNLKEFPSLEKVVTLTYSTSTGNSSYGTGVRVFVIKKK
jgi:hypothetical protein